MVDRGFSAASAAGGQSRGAVNVQQVVVLLCIDFAWKGTREGHSYLSDRAELQLLRRANQRQISEWKGVEQMPANVDGNTIETPTNLNWYALHTRSRHEKTVAARLDSQATEVFLPLHRSRRHWKNGVQAEVDLPLFPCYLFARASIFDRHRLLQTPGVLGFAATSAHHSSIPDEEMTLLQNETESIKEEPYHYINIGKSDRH